MTLPKISISDDELLNEAMACIADACSFLIEVKNPMGITLHHMADSILCYVEEYIYKNEDYYGFKKPRKRKIKNDPTA